MNQPDESDPTVVAKQAEFTAIREALDGVDAELVERFGPFYRDAPRSKEIAALLGQQASLRAQAATARTALEDALRATVTVEDVDG